MCGTPWHISSVPGHLHRAEVGGKPSYVEKAFQVLGETLDTASTHMALSLAGKVRGNSAKSDARPGAPHQAGAGEGTGAGCGGDQAAADGRMLVFVVGWEKPPPPSLCQTPQGRKDHKHSSTLALQ